MAREGEKLLQRASRRSTGASPARLLQQLKERFAAVEQIDFFAVRGGTAC